MNIGHEYNVFLVNLGCPKNQVDGETMLGKLLGGKFKIALSYKQAEIVIINTCGFIDAAKKESTETILEYISKWKKNCKDKFLIVTGCLVGRYKEKLCTLLPEVDGWLVPGELDKIGLLINDIVTTKNKKAIFTKNSYAYLSLKDDRKIENLTNPFSAYIKIADGCNNHCSYCVIPIIRGKYKSRTIESISEEVEKFAEQGVKEINIIAQDITNFGLDIYNKRKLPDLLKSLLKIKGLYWIRLLYAYPEHLMPELIEIMKSESKICKYLDIPLQHIDDRILKSMHRQSTEKSIRKIIYNIKENIPDIALRSSFIVGFPGETKKEFDKLRSWIEEIQFDYIGVFTYSKEEGTAAYSMPKQTAKKIKEERQAELLKIQSKISHKKNMNRIDNVYTLLIESQKGKKLFGRLECQALEIDGEVIIEKGNASPGDFVKVKITDAVEYNLYGKICI
ncbi:30S ribosomal protein S12 methylthiotransferase RimO [Candidatus Poribacteria bacterium]|nr:30S ribosomal protein S12 methylthiotransferase RimO [Candidatus Poribacteria bacterium]